MRSLRYICIGPLCLYAIYTVPGLAFALAYHNLCLPFSLATPIRAITRKRLLDAVRDALDGFALRFWPYLSRLYGPRLCDGQSDITHLFSIVWMTIFGGFALTIEADQPGQLGNILQNGGPERVLYAVLDHLPMGGCSPSLLSF